MSPSPQLGQIHHTAHVVEDLEAATRRLHDQFGAGPFFHLEEVPVTDVTSRGEPAVFKHASVFGICLGLPVELMQMDRVEGTAVGDHFAAAGPNRFHHLAYAVPPETLATVREELDRKGMPEYLSARFGDDVEFSFHDTGAELGYDLEIHADSEGFRTYFASLYAAAEGWDGTGLLRPPG